MISSEEEQELLAALENPIPKPPAPPTSGFSMWSWLVEVVGYNTAMIFGDTGSAKTKTCEQIAYECAKEGRKVKYIDHESNLSHHDVETMQRAGITYKLIADSNKLYSIKTDEISGFDLIIIDSATLAITGKWASLDMHGKGEILQRLQGMVYKISQECIGKQKSIVIFTAQPISVMGDRKNLAPVGDKCMFMTKEIYYMFAPRNEEGIITKRVLKSYRSRNFPDGTIISEIHTQKFGVKFDYKRLSDIMQSLKPEQ